VTGASLRTKESLTGNLSEVSRARAITARLSDGLHGLVEMDHRGWCKPVNSRDRVCPQWQRVVEVGS
jgi:hypothetical protein